VELFQLPWMGNDAQKLLFQNYKTFFIISQ
jgi:hypothetical protein